MSRLGSYLAPPPQAGGHLLDEMGGGNDLRLLVLGDLQSSPGECRLDLSSGHGLRLHG